MMTTSQASSPHSVLHPIPLEKTVINDTLTFLETGWTTRGSARSMRISVMASLMDRAVSPLGREDGITGCAPSCLGDDFNFSDLRNASDTVVRPVTRPGRARLS